ncbi:reverse transcriptase domain-containing protein [Tanacetum coccineum]
MLISKTSHVIAPEEKEELIIYLAASKEAVSVVLMTEREAKQMPIYFVSRALRGPEVNYTSMEKLVLALVHASKRLRRYFQAHLTPRISVKGQVLADFIVERPEEENPDASAKEEEPLPAQWTLFTDGTSQTNLRLAGNTRSSCSMHAGTRSVVAKALRTGYYWPTMHNDARALIKACQEMPPKILLQLKHPQTNGLVERANRSLREGIKARLGKDNKNWLEEISHVLWAHRTMVKSSNGDTPFSLTYGTEAVIPTKIRMPTFRTTEVNVAKNDEALEINLELLEEKREQAAIREAKSKRQMEKYYNTKVRNASFKLGDLVYRSNEASRVEDTGKLGPKWEGPYEVTEALRKGSYKLKDRNGRELPRTWNVCNLKKCYIHKV